MRQSARRDPPAQLDLKVQLAHKDLRETLVQRALLGLSAPLAHKDLKATQVRPVLRELWVRLVL